MTYQHKIAGGLVVFALLALVSAPFVSTPASAVGKSEQSVSIAISSGSHLRLIEQAAAGDHDKRTTQGMLCQRVYRFAFADVGVRCTAASHARKLVKLEAD